VALISQNFVGTYQFNGSAWSLLGNVKTFTGARGILPYDASFVRGGRIAYVALNAMGFMNFDGTNWTIEPFAHTVPGYFRFINLSFLNSTRFIRTDWISSGSSYAPYAIAFEYELYPALLPEVL
jgi:hypothetical protein